MRGATAQLSAPRHGERAPFYGLWLPLPAVALMGLGATRRKRWMTALLLGVLLLSLAVLLASCGGGGASLTPPTAVGGTPAGNYAITVQGTATGGLQHSTVVNFTVR